MMTKVEITFISLHQSKLKFIFFKRISEHQNGSSSAFGTKRTFLFWDTIKRVEFAFKQCLFERLLTVSNLCTCLKIAKIGPCMGENGSA